MSVLLMGGVALISIAKKKKKKSVLISIGKSVLISIAKRVLIRIAKSIDQYWRKKVY